MNNYDEKFYNRQEKGSLNSARKILPIIMDLIDINSVMDIGCGLGTWLSVFNELGVDDVIGLDGSWVNKDRLYIEEDNFIRCDLEDPIEISRKFDLVMSLEVAEHLNESNTRNFIKYLTNHSSFILFSAAIPNQGGTNHLNEQWPDYWIKLFKEMDFQVVDWLRGQIWNDLDIEAFYRQNIFLFIENKFIQDFKRNLSSYNHIYSIVHPERYTCKVNYLRGKLEKQKKIENELKNELHNSTNKIHKYKKKIKSQEKIIDNMKTSNSWKITKPLRRLKKLK